MQPESLHGNTNPARAATHRRPKHDLAADMAKAIFEENGPQLYRAYLKAALKGNGYIFETLANRAFGNLKETVAVDVGPYREMSDDDLKARIARYQFRCD